MSSLTIGKNIKLANLYHEEFWEKLVIDAEKCQE